MKTRSGIYALSLVLLFALSLGLLGCGGGKEEPQSPSYPDYPDYTPGKAQKETR